MRNRLLIHVKCRMPKQMKVYAAGFTLIELLVVVSIIGVLASLSFASFAGSQQRGRDSQRKFDMRSASAALEQYYSQSSTYPTGSDFTTMAGQLGSLLKVMPSDPSRSPSNYYYAAQSCNGLGTVCTSYYLCTQLENLNDQDISVTGKYSCPDTVGHPASQGWYGFAP